MKPYDSDYDESDNEAADIARHERADDSRDRRKDDDIVKEDWVGGMMHPFTPMGRIAGRWPGNETDEEIEQALNMTNARTSHSQAFDSHYGDEHLIKLTDAEEVMPIFDVLSRLWAEGYRTCEQDGNWHLFRKDGEGIAIGKTFRDLCVNIVLAGL